jgi:hypothetical protein
MMSESDAADIIPPKPTPRRDISEALVLSSALGS